MILAADMRRRTQTFYSADLAEQKMLALRAGEVSGTWRSAGELLKLKTGAVDAIMASMLTEFDDIRSFLG
jgi:hypothetical protein